MSDTPPHELPSKTFRAAVDTAPEAVTVTDPDGNMAYINRSAARILGYDDPEELLGDSWKRVYDESELERLEGEIEESLATHGTWRGEAVGTTNDWGKIPLDISVALVETGHIVVVGSDVTDRKRREWELKRQNERLDEFASVLTHDLRNPLNVAQGYLALAREEHDAEELAAVADALDRMNQLIDDVLSVARRGDAVTTVEPVSIPEIAERAWRNVETDGATLAVEAESTIAADGTRLLQLVENVLGNAVEHGSTSPRSQVHEDAVERGDGVTVRVGDLRDGFYVEDTGPGISEADRENVFDFGYTTRVDGTGFGLAIVKQIADAHGWTVSVAESDEGGARFEFRNVSECDVTRPTSTE